jgi:hypothetical protein
VSYNIFFRIFFELFSIEKYDMGWGDFL